jgi:hypothetical protein
MEESERSAERRPPDDKHPGGDEGEKENILFLSKINTLGECPRKYWWEYYEKLSLRRERGPMEFGADFHDLAKELKPRLGEVDEPILRALAKTSEILNPEDREAQVELVKGLYEKLNELELEILDAEESYYMPMPGPVFTRWYIKPDSHLREKSTGNLWVGEYKTTSGYGAATARFYHTSPQTVTYFFIEHERVPKVKGTYLFILNHSKKKQEVFPEKVLLTKEDAERAKMFIKTMHQYAEKVEKDHVFPRIMTKCHPYRGSECEFLKICFLEEGDYKNELLQSLYEFKDPKAHLGL